MAQVSSPCGPVYETNYTYIPPRNASRGGQRGDGKILLGHSIKIVEYRFGEPGYIGCDLGAGGRHAGVINNIPTPSPARRGREGGRAAKGMGCARVGHKFVLSADRPTDRPSD